MGTGAIIWTCLALTLHQGPIQEYPMSSKGFKIPITIKPERVQEVQELVLLVSKDKGGTWEVVDRKPPSEHDFIYHAPADGSYWFIVQQVNHNNKTVPENPSRVKPNMAVLVDTTRPQVKVSAERTPTGEIRARWTVTDLYPDTHSVRLEYRTSAVPEGQWTPLGVLPSLEGNKEFNPGREGLVGEVRVRVQARDQAGNQGEEVAIVPPGGAGGNSSAASGGEGSPFSVIPTTRTEPSNAAAQTTSRQGPRPSLDPSPAPGVMPPAPTPPTELTTTNPAPPPGGLPIAGNIERPPAPPGNLAETPGNASALKIVKSREVRLDFTVAKVGPSGLGNADIYVTLDRGATWKKMPGEVPITLPPSTDVRGSEPVSGSVSVQLPAEATIYGFIVAVKSKAGLAPPPPKPGDQPEALVELDTTAPKGQLFRPQPDSSQPNTLLLLWEAKDRNLAEKPITLEWSEQKDGQWTIIGEGPLPNSGQYAWRLPEHLPPRVYLRLTMKDLAGNESRAQTDKPELIDLSVPQTRITGVAPNGR